MNQIYSLTEAKTKFSEIINLLESKTRSNSLLFQDFCSLKSAKDNLEMRCQNVAKLFLREPLGPAVEITPGIFQTNG